MPFRTRPSTAAERSVAVYAGAFVLAALGGLALYFAWSKHAGPGTAIPLRNIGLAFLGLAGGLVATRWAMVFLMDD
jgi:hypothetical protein